MRTLTTPRIAWLLELYALLLAGIQMFPGVHTDEAKYLLSIPYPHPPILRSIIAATAGFPAQEFLWRFIIASALVQAVWLLRDLGYVIPRPRRIALAASWLFASAVILQAGTVMMAPISGLFGLICVWLVLRAEPLPATFATVLGCVWFVGIFSTYQSVLYLPLLVSALHASNVSWRKIAILIGTPLLLLILYTFSNPYVLATFFKVATQDAPLTLDVRIWNILWTYLIAGSGILSVVGTFGLLTGGRKDLLITFGIVLAYIALTSQEYYGILLTPLLCAGVFLLFCKRRLSSTVYLSTLAFLSILFVIARFPQMVPTPARATVRFLEAKHLDSFVLIDGYFGHDWQFESRGVIRRYSQDLSSMVESEATAVVCTKRTCEEDINGDEWKKLEGAPLEVWERK